jgi:hypothetical protein
MNKNEPIKAHWDSGFNNFGDILTPYLIEKISGKKAVLCKFNKQEQKIVVTGSILSYDLKKTTVWGAGVFFKNSKISRGCVNFLAVRGPLTAKLVKQQFGKEVEIVGDPGILVRRFYPKKYLPFKERKYIGIVPHYIDYKKIKMMNFDPDIFKVIDIKIGVENFIDELVECKKIFSSTLHGIIGSQSMETPTAWVKFSDKVHGDDTKFHDYFQSVNPLTPQSECLDMRVYNKEKMEETFLSHEPEYVEIPELMMDRLLSVCPF